MCFHMSALILPGAPSTTSCVYTAIFALLALTQRFDRVLFGIPLLFLFAEAFTCVLSAFWNFKFLLLLITVRHKVNKLIKT